MIARVVLTGVILMISPAAAQVSPYAGQEGRDVKALSPQEIEDLLVGRGMGFAKAAELNGYPGPAHALELADRLELDAEQIAAIRGVHQRMEAAARTLGADLVARERALDRLFAQGHIDPASLAGITAEIGRLWGELRRVHLAAHLETRVRMSEAQIHRYKTLRGYVGGATGHGGGYRHGQ